MKYNGPDLICWAVDPHIAVADQAVDHLEVAFCLIHPDGSRCGNIGSSDFTDMLPYTNEHHRLGAIALM